MPPNDLAMLPQADAPVATDAARELALERYLSTSDISQLGPAERVAVYLELCRSLGLNSASRPFDWIFFKASRDEPERLVLYPNQSAAAQLRRQHHLRIEITRRERVGDLFVVEATAHAPDGRSDVASKYVSITYPNGERLRGTQLANAMMKAETGAKRRVTLSMVGLSSAPSEEEAASWRRAVIDGKGFVVEKPTDEDKYLAATPAAAAAIGAPTFETTVPVASPVPSTASQAATPEEIAPQSRPPGERPSFKPSKEDVEHRLKTWFAVVDGTSLDDDDARHRFVEQWTASYVPTLRTSSLRDFMSHATDRQAEDLLAHVRAVCDDEKRAIAEPDDDEEAF